MCVATYETIHLLMAVLTLNTGQKVCKYIRRICEQSLGAQKLHHNLVLFQSQETLPRHTLQNTLCITVYDCLALYA